MKVIIQTTDSEFYFGHSVFIDGEEVIALDDDSLGDADVSLRTLIQAVFVRAAAGEPLEIQMKEVN